MSLKTNRDRLIETTKKGGISLILGAGISRSLGIPNWEELAKQVWELAFPDRMSPWDAPEEMSPRNLPQFLPIVFEMALQKLKSEKFIRDLQYCLYKNFKSPALQKKNTSKSSLAVLAKLMQQEHKAGGKRRLLRVITFNVDNLLERATSGGGYGKRASKSFGRAGKHPNWGRGDEPIPIYHLHGFIPMMARRDQFSWVKNYDHMLVFTDSQYWSSSSTMLSFANRIMGSALYDSHCVFIGLSMTDVNLLRWLALRHNELMDEWNQISSRNSKTTREKITWREPPQIITGLRRHFWIRTKSADPTGFLTEFLEARGVKSVKIRNWSGDHFGNLIHSCFPHDIGK